MIQNLTQFPTLNKLKNLIFQSAMLFLLVFGLGEKLTAQTNPTAQALPYTQNFGTTTFTSMPTGMAAWQGGNRTTQSAAEGSAPTVDATITAATASLTGGNIYGYAVSSNAQAYIQQSSNATNGTNQIVAAINTGASTSVTLAYDLSLINGGVTTQDYGHAVQYRSGTSGAWTTISGSAMTFGAVATYTTTTKTFTITGLTANTAYQFRWIVWRPSGSGASKGIGIDNISISGVATNSNPLISSSTATQNTTVLSAYAGYIITASNAPTSYSATGMPAGLSVNTSTGAISGTPTTGSVGTYTVTATATNGSGSGTATFLLNVNKANQSITFGSLANKTVGDPAITLGATASSGLAVSYATSDAGVAALSGNSLSFPGAGTAIITASQAGNADYNAASNVTQNQLVNSASLLNQTISFTLSSPVIYGASPITLTGTGGASGNAVTYVSSAPAIASVSGNTLTVLKAGTVTITASQAGNATYNAAPDVAQTLVVNPLGISITGATASPKTYDGTTVATITGASIASSLINGDVVALSAPAATFASANAGTAIPVTTNYTLTGANASNYTLTVQPSGLTADINKATPTINFGTLSSIGVGGTATLAATTTPAGLTPITYTSSNTSVATIATNVANGVALGTTTITASFAGDSNYNAAADTTQPLTVAAVPVMYNFGTTVADPTPTSGLPIANLTFGSVTLNSSIGGTNNSINVTSPSTGTGTYTGASGLMNAAVASQNGPYNVSTSAYYEVTITPTTGYAVNLNSISFGSRSTSTGPTNIDIRTSADGYVSAVSTFTVANASAWGLRTPTLSGAPIVSNTPLTIRIYGYQPAGASTLTSTSNANFRVDDISISANATIASCTTPTVTVTGNQTICNGSSITLTAAGASTYVWSSNAASATTAAVSVSPTTNTTYTVTGKDVTGGCSASTIVAVVVNQPSTPSSVSLTPACGVTSVTLPNGATTSATSQAVTYANAVGCDSIVTYNITYKASSAPSAVALTPACGVTSVTLPNGASTSNTNAVVTYTNVAGCDSVVTYNITYKVPSASMNAMSNCTAITWNGQSVAATGTYTASFTNVAGCDSIATLNFTKLNATSSTISITQFFSYVIPGTTTTITTSGTTNQVYTAANTCDSTVTYNVTIKGLVLCAKAFLSGPYNATTGLMTDSLRQKGLLPLSTPYGSGTYTLGYTSVNNISTETTTPAVLSVTGNNAIVDWVFVQIRSKADSSIVLGTRSALMQRDGDIVEMDGTSPLKFADFLPDNFFVSIKHRNHIGIMTANKYALSLTPNCIDFTTTSTPLFIQPGKKGNPAPLTGPTRIQNGVRTLYAGNCNILTALTSRFITYNVLTTSDRNELYVATGGTNTLNTYTIYDVDMNGFARFNGLDPDRNVILSNCAGSNSLITNEQTPN
jgi:hypothetical protein